MLNSISALRRTIAGAAVAAAMLFPATAANAVILSFTGVDPTTGTIVGPSGPNNTVVYQLSIPFDGGTISNVESVDLSISFSTSWIVPAGSLQIFGITFLTDPVKLGAGTSAIGSLSVNGGSAVLAGCGDCLAFNAVNAPGSSLSIDELSLLGFLEYAGDPATLLGIALTYTVENANETPLPAALPLFASGLAVMGIVARRRKKKAQAAG